jgi:pyruvate/2-oxoglutarate dehydrogenase complex dihydrolipoamide acyltransferase (E2) component
MPTKVALPEMGEGVTDATVTQWLKKEGDQVKKYEPLVEVNTDKVDTEIPSPADGVVLKIVQPADTVVAVNEVLCWVGEPGEEIPENGDVPAVEAVPPEPAAREPEPPATQPAAPTPEPVPASEPEERLPEAPDDGRLRGAVSPLAARIAADQNVDPGQIEGSGIGGMVVGRDVLAFVESGGANRRAGAPAGSPAQKTAEPTDPIANFISPVVGRLALEHDIDLTHVDGTGKHGRITKFDIQRVIESGGAARSGSIEPHPAFTRYQPGSVVKHTPVRRSIARHMLESKHASPHVSTFFEADMSAVFNHRKAHKDEFARQGVNLTFTAYIVRAAAAALQAYPLVNSSWSEDGIILHSEINIGMAVSLDADGLIVPVIRKADRLSLFETARAVNDLAGRARSKQLNPEEVRGGTFTITNHGTSGSLFATPVINQPQCGILGTGTIQKRPVVVNDAIAIKPMAYVSLTFDHRILDGAVADYFLQAVRQGLESGSF